jgi:hypothetical protein
LTAACGKDLPVDTSESDSGEQDSETETETTAPPSDVSESSKGTETGTEDAGFDPQCGEWTSTLVDAERLDDIWLDGDELVATGGRVLVERSDGGVWSDYVDFSLENPVFAYDEVWGPAGDRWVLARAGLETSVYHHDGVSLAPRHRCCTAGANHRSWPSVPTGCSFMTAFMSGATRSARYPERPGSVTRCRCPTGP